MNLFKPSKDKVDYYQPEPSKPTNIAKTSVITWLWLFILMLAVATVVLFIIWYRYQYPSHDQIPTKTTTTTKTNTVMTVSPTLPLVNNNTTPASLLQNITLATTNSETIIDFHFNGKAAYSILHQPTTNQLIVTLPKIRLTQTAKLNKLKSGLVIAINSVANNNGAQVFIKTKTNTNIEHVAYLKDHKTLQMILYQKSR